MGHTGDHDMAALTLDPATQTVGVDDLTPTVSVQWDRAVQDAVSATGPGPTIASRAYAMMHTAMYDVWAASDEVAAGIHLETSSALTEAEIDEAMSFAAHAVLSVLFPNQAQAFDARLVAMGYDPADAGPEAQLGNLAANALLAARVADGSNQSNGYAAPTTPTGDPIYRAINGGPHDIVAIDRWTPENIPLDPEDGVPEQRFLTPHWGGVDPFGLDSGDAIRPVPPEPFFLVDGATLNIPNKTITLADGTVLGVSRDLIGTVINPAFVAQAERVVDASANLTDAQKLTAEFWEDGRGTSFPPGTFMTFAQYVSARDDHTQGEDARMFLAISNAQMDAGIATWESKTHYDYARPVRVIRELGDLGLIGTYGTDELTGETGHVIRAWGGPGLGTRTILAENFITYQTPGQHPSPPFAEYTSGHSAFSAAGAEVLRLFSGSDAFGGSVTFEPGQSRFEPGTGPADAVTLAWDTFTKAADDAGMSRIYGGIHFDDGDMNGRALGREAGREAFGRAMAAIQGIGDGAGNDVIAGTRGDDVLGGLAGNDRLETGAGSDTVVFRGGDGADRITDFDLNGRFRDGAQIGADEAVYDTLVLTGLGELDGEYSTATDFRDLIAAMEADGDARTNAIIRKGGLQLLFGEGGSITLDRIAAALGGRDSLYEIGVDHWRAAPTDGDDVLGETKVSARYDGGLGDDVIGTGAGWDVVAYGAGGGADQITDFALDEGTGDAFDTLELRGFGALDGAYSSAADLLALMDRINKDSDPATNAGVSGDSLILDFSNGDSVTIARVGASLIV